MIPELGTANDMDIRKNFKREDTTKKSVLIRKARALIYNKGKSVKSNAVESLLKETSLVPTKVSWSYPLSAVLRLILETLA